MKKIKEKCDYEYKYEYNNKTSNNTECNKEYKQDNTKDYYSDEGSTRGCPDLKGYTFVLDKANLCYIMTPRKLYVTMMG